MDSDWLEVIDWIPKWCGGVRDPRQIPHLLCNQLQTAARLAALCSAVETSPEAIPL